MFNVEPKKQQSAKNMTVDKFGKIHDVNGRYSTRLKISEMKVKQLEKQIELNKANYKAWKSAHQREMNKLKTELNELKLWKQNIQKENGTYQKGMYFAL